MGTLAESLAARGLWAGLASAVVGGALVALLSFLVLAADGVGAQVTLAFFIGFLLALRPFDHVIVTGLHVFMGILLDARLGYAVLGGVLAVATVGNMIGGFGLVALSHVAEAEGAGEPEEEAH